jgi:hypothetical protein
VNRLRIFPFNAAANKAMGESGFGACCPKVGQGIAPWRHAPRIWWDPYRPVRLVRQPSKPVPSLLLVSGTPSASTLMRRKLSHGTTTIHARIMRESLLLAFSDQVQRERGRGRKGSRPRAAVACGNAQEVLEATGDIFDLPGSW